MWLKARRRRLLTIVLVLAAIFGAYVLGFENTRHELADEKQLVQQLQLEGQKLKDQVDSLNAKLLAEETSSRKLSATLNELMPAKDTYQIVANQSLIVANGRLTIGLVGSPGNQGIDININGKQRPAVSGDVIEVPGDPSTTCHVRVQAFDMFTALVTATCP